MTAPDRSLGFITLPEGKDPDDLIKSGGKAAMDALLAAPEPLVERLWRHERDAAPLTTPETRAGLRQRLYEHAKTIADAGVRDQYQLEFRRRFDEAYRNPPAPGPSAGRPARKRTRPDPTPPSGGGAGRERGWRR